MKKYILIFSVVTFYVTHAQLNQLQIVGRPEKAETEIVGVRDVNGRFCAAVQMLSDMDGFSYDAYNGVVRVDDNPGKDMVYLQPDERVVEIYHTGYEPLKIILSEIGIQLHEREVWVLKLSGEKTLTQIPIVIITNPSGAEVTLDEVNRGRIEQHRVSAGSHRLRLSKEGYQPVIETIFVDEENTLFKYDLAIQQDVNVQIETDPPGAAVYVDDVKLGTTPVSNFYPAGKYRLRIEREWYLTYEDMIDIRPPYTQRKIALQKNFGSMSVESAPESGLEIFFNGFSKNVYTPHTFERLQPGTYVVRARSLHHETDEQTISVQRGGSSRVQLRSMANFSILTVKTNEGASVYLDGQKLTGFENIRLEPSVVMIRAELPKAKPREKRVVLKRNQSHTVDLYLDVPLGTIQVGVVPPDARMELRGDAGEHYTSTGSKVFRGIPAGRYSLNVRKIGYKPYRKTLRLKEGEKITHSVTLSKMDTKTVSIPPSRPISRGLTRGTIVFSSFLFPGMGQIRAGRKIGWIYTAAAVASGGLWFYTLRTHNRYMEEYEDQRIIYYQNPTGYSRKTYQAAYDRAEGSYRNTVVTIGAFWCIYILNIIDAMTFKPKMDRYSEIKLQPRILTDSRGEAQPGIGLEVSL